MKHPRVNPWYPSFLRQNPLIILFAFSSFGEWTRSTSAWPRLPISIAIPDPTEIVLTVYPLCFSNIGTKTSRSPESTVLVVVESIIVLEAAIDTVKKDTSRKAIKLKCKNLLNFFNILFSFPNGRPGCFPPNPIVPVSLPNMV